MAMSSKVPPTEAGAPKATYAEELQCEGPEGAFFIEPAKPVVPVAVFQSGQYVPVTHAAAVSSDDDVFDLDLSDDENGEKTDPGFKPAPLEFPKAEPLPIPEGVLHRRRTFRRAIGAGLAVMALGTAGGVVLSRAASTTTPSTTPESIATTTPILKNPPIASVQKLESTKLVPVISAPTVAPTPVAVATPAPKEPEAIACTFDVDSSGRKLVPYCSPAQTVAMGKIQVTDAVKKVLTAHVTINGKDCTVSGLPFPTQAGTKNYAGSKPATCQ